MAVFVVSELFPVQLASIYGSTDTETLSICKITFRILSINVPILSVIYGLRTFFQATKQRTIAAYAKSNTSDTVDICIRIFPDFGFQCNHHNGKQMMKLWIMNTEKEKDNFDFYFSILMKKEKERVLRFRFEEDRVRSVLGAYLIHQAFFEDFPNEEYELAYNTFGKPYYPPRLLAQKQAYFNLSHSGKLVVLAKAEYDLGVDVEKIRELHFEKFTPVFSKDEIAKIRNSAVPAESFFELWTRKEAFVKCIGKGISALAEYDEKGNDFSYITKHYEGHIITVCSKIHNDDLEIVIY